MANQNNKKIKNNTINKTSNIKKNNTVSKATGRIDTKKVFPKKQNSLKVEEISVEDALSSRVKRYQKLYNNTNNNDKNINTNSKSDNKKEEKLSITKQQKFNFDNNKVEDEIDIDNKSSVKKEKKVPKRDEKISFKIEEIPVKKALHKNDDYSTIIMLFLTVVIVFMGVFLIYHFGTFDHDKEKIVYKVKKVEVVPENILFLGDSITDFYDLKKFFPNRKTVNSGISGNTTQDILDDLENRAYRYNPSHIFLLIGINDLYEKVDNSKIISNIEEIVKNLEKNLPNSKIYLESIYPINKGAEDKINHAILKNRENEDVRSINKELKKFAKEEKITYVNMYDKLSNKYKDLKLEYTNEGLHLNDEGYKKVTWEINKILKEE